MDKLTCKGLPLGRILIGLVFAIFGLLKLIGFSATVAFIESAGLPLATLGAVVAVVLELGGGLLILLNKYVGKTALILSIYVLILTVLFHLDFSNQLQVTMLLKNLAIIGGLALLCDCKTCSTGKQNS